MAKLVFLIDVDNTLLNNDAVKQDFDNYLHSELGPALSERFWEFYEQVRAEKNVVDIPASLVCFREHTPLSDLPEAAYLRIFALFDGYPFREALYPQALTTLRYLDTLGQTVILSDGDHYFQAKKIITSQLAEAVEGRVLLYVHKQQHLDEIFQFYPADHYAIVDDKPQILVDMKALLGPRVTTVFVKQGKYAQKTSDGFAPDITVSHLADLQSCTAEQFLVPAGKNS